MLGESTPHESHPSPDFESELEKVETLGNIRKNKHLTGFSAKLRNERLGRIRNQSGRHLGDSLQGLLPVRLKVPGQLKVHPQALSSFWIDTNLHTSN